MRTIFPIVSTALDGSEKEPVALVERCGASQDAFVAAGVAVKTLVRVERRVKMVAVARCILLDGRKGVSSVQLDSIRERCTLLY
jgi:hypothetical protein